jgi:hypothetical protein
MNALARAIAAPRLPRNVILLAFTGFCTDVSSEMPYPVLPMSGELVRSRALGVGNLVNHARSRTCVLQNQSLPLPGA